MCGLEIHSVSDEGEKGLEKIMYQVKLCGRGREGVRTPIEVACSFTNDPFLGPKLGKEHRAQHRTDAGVNPTI